MIFRKTSRCLLIAFVLFIQVLKAQVTITIPTNNLHSSSLTAAEWRKPFGTYFGYERSAMIYQHSEIGQFGNITSLSFYCDTLNVPGDVPLAIYMKEIAGSAFTSNTTVAQEESGAQLVYSGTLPASSFVKGQWVTVTLTSPFLHTSSNSVEVIMETNAGGTGNEGILAKGFYHYLTSIYAFQYWSADNAAPTGLGIKDYQRPNIQLGITPATACSGQPNAGITMAAADTTCSEATLYLTGSDVSTGLTYQWQDSLAGGAWTNISGANAPSLSTSIHANTWFRCAVSCGSQFSYSSVKEVIARSYLQCYCNASLGGGCSGSAIDSVAIAGTGLVTSATGCSANNYTLYPALGNTCAQITSGQSYDLHTRFNGNVIASVWIDYDQNGNFDSSEWKQIATFTQVDSDYVTVLSVPVNAKNGLTVMRIRTRAAGNLNGHGDACTNFGSGETEDYFIGINYDVNVAGIKKESRVVLYPNPAGQSIWLAGDLPKGERLQIAVFSIDGSLEKEWMSTYNSDPISFDVSQLPRGAHFIKVASSSVNLIKRVVLVE